MIRDGTRRRWRIPRRRGKRSEQRADSNSTCVQEGLQRLRKEQTRKYGKWFTTGQSRSRPLFGQSGLKEEKRVHRQQKKGVLEKRAVRFAGHETGLRIYICSSVYFDCAYARLVRLKGSCRVAHLLVSRVTYRAEWHGRTVGTKCSARWSSSTPGRA